MPATSEMLMVAEAIKHLARPKPDEMRMMLIKGDRLVTLDVPIAVSRDTRISVDDIANRYLVPAFWQLDQR